MQKHYNYLTIDLDKKVYRTLNAKQGDSKSRYILVNLISNNLAYDLTGTSVKIYGKKKDTTIFFNAAPIIDAKNGQFEIELTNQALAVPGYLKIEILVLGANQERLSTSYFYINVEETIIDDAAIESTNEFTALTNALSEVQDIDNKFSKVNEQFNTNVKLNDFRNTQNKNIIAHRGFGGIYPENTLYSFKESLKYTDELEFDVMVTSDGQLVIHHDDTIDRTSNGSGRIDSFTLSQLKTYDFGYKHFGNVITGIQIPTVQEFFNSINAKRYYWEIKGYRTINDVDLMTNFVINKGLEDRVEFSSFFWRDIIPKVRLLTDKITFGCVLNNQTDFNEAVKMFETEKNISLVIPYTLINDDNIKVLHSKNIPYSVWTFTLNRDYEWYKQFGISKIISDIPMEVR